MKTAINILTLLIMGSYIFFLTTLTFQKPQENHPPPKSTRVITLSTNTRNTPFPSHQKQSQNLTDPQLRSAIKAEWSKLNNRSNNRELPILISHLRELGRREALDGLLFLNELPSSGYPTDALQAKIAIIAGWGLDDHVEAATFLYTNINLLKEHGTTWLVSPNIMEKALELAEYEIQSRWIHEDSDGFLAMLDQADTGFPVNPARRARVSQRFPQLPTPEPIEDPFKGLDVPDIRPPFDKQYREALGGERANSLAEWAARNPERAYEFLKTQISSDTETIKPEHLETIAFGLSHQVEDYQALMEVIPEKEKTKFLQALVLSIHFNPSDYVWPVDARPDPIRLTNKERAEALESFLVHDQSFPEALRKGHLKDIRSILSKD